MESVHDYLDQLGNHSQHSQEQMIKNHEENNTFKSQQYIFKMAKLSFNDIPEKISFKTLLATWQVLEQLSYE
jgi:hypothetical protein